LIHIFECKIAILKAIFLHIKKLQFYNTIYFNYGGKYKMASIERTAYPRLRINITQRELKEKYTPTMDETHFAHTVARGKKSVANYLTLLKCFQNLGYFLPIDEIPYIIVKHINRVFGIEKNGIPNTRKNTIYNYYKSIRHYLNIKQYDELAKKLLIDTVTKNSYTMDNPADLINSAIDILVKNNYELPAYSHLGLPCANPRNF